MPKRVHVTVAIEDISPRMNEWGNKADNRRFVITVVQTVRRCKTPDYGSRKERKRQNTNMTEYAL